MSKLRWAKFFWADWSNDTALRLCSMGARGLWMELLCIAAQGEPYGAITIKGRDPSERELRQLCRLAYSKNAARNFRNWLAELERHGVLVRVDIIPSAGSPTLPRRVMASSRMLHDGVIAMKRASASRNSWILAENRQNPRDLHVQKPGNGAGLHEENNLLHTIEAEAEAEEEPPRAPPVRGGQIPKQNSRRRKKEDDGWTQLTTALTAKQENN